MFYIVNVCFLFHGRAHEYLGIAVTRRDVIRELACAWEGADNTMIVSRQFLARGLIYRVRVAIGDRRRTLLGNISNNSTRKDQDVRVG